MGGWTSAVAKQYNLGESDNMSRGGDDKWLTDVIDTTACGFSVDLDSFL